jgi:hypothetical protein
MANDWGGGKAAVGDARGGTFASPPWGNTPPRSERFRNLSMSSSGGLRRTPAVRAQFGWPRPRAGPARGRERG